MKNPIFALLLLAVPAAAQEGPAYQLPPPEILALADYQRAPQVRMDTKKEWMLLIYRPTYKSLDELAQEELRLAGLRVNPVTNISSQMSYISNLKVRRVEGTEELQVQGLPPDAKIAYTGWSRDERKIAFTNTTAVGVELWVLDVAAARAIRLTGPVLNANLGQPYTWLADSASLLVRLLPVNRPALLDAKKELPKGPVVSESDGSVSRPGPTRTC
jgi:hypothetical protein